jgi:hypothetical protein
MLNIILLKNTIIISFKELLVNKYKQITTKNI